MLDVDILDWDRLKGSAEAQAKLAGAFEQGAVVAFPTESSYGLGAATFHSAALGRLLALKGGRGRTPLPVVLGEAADAARIAVELPELFAAAAAAFWPGPLSLVVRARSDVPELVTGGGDTVALRLPGHPAARWAARAAGGCLTATSANRSGDPPALTPDQVRIELGEGLDVLIDGGGLPGGPPSTVVDLRTLPVRILRQGALERAAIEQALNVAVQGADRLTP